MGIDVPEVGSLAQITKMYTIIDSCKRRYHSCRCSYMYSTCSMQDGEAMPMGGASDVLSTGGGLSGDTHGLEDDEQEDEDTPIFEKHDTLLHGERITQKFLSSTFMKKYIHVARVMKPVLTREACDIISTEYTKLRAQDTSGTDKAKVSTSCSCDKCFSTHPSPISVWMLPHFIIDSPHHQQFPLHY